MIKKGIFSMQNFCNKQNYYNELCIIHLLNLGRKEKLSYYTASNYYFEDLSKSKTYN